MRARADGGDCPLKVTVGPSECIEIGKQILNSACVCMIAQRDLVADGCHSAARIPVCEVTDDLCPQILVTLCAYHAFTELALHCLVPIRDNESSAGEDVENTKVDRAPANMVGEMGIQIDSSA